MIFMKALNSLQMTSYLWVVRSVFLTYIRFEAPTDDLPSMDCTCPKCLLLHSKVLAWINKLAKLYNIIVCTIYKFRFSNCIKVRWQIQSPQLTCMHSHEMNVLSRKGTKHNTTQERVCGNYKKVTQVQTKSFIGDSCIDPSQRGRRRGQTHHAHHITSASFK